MGGGGGEDLYILLKSMLIQYNNLIFKKIYYLEVHMQKIGQLHNHIVNYNVQNILFIIIFKRLRSHQKGREENSVDCAKRIAPAY